MSDVRTGDRSTSTRVADRLPEVVDGVEQLKTAVVENTDDEGAAAIVEEIWDVVEEIEDLLESVDLREVPDVVDSDVLIELLSSSEVPGKVVSGESVDVRDLLGMKDAIELRELWEAVDLERLLTELRELRAEVDDLTGGSGGDGSEDTDRTAGGDDPDPGSGGEELQETVQRAVEDTVEAVRPAVLDAHDAIRLLYEHNRQAFGGGSRRPASRNPTAVSTLPNGPLPTSVSTRVSTVPAQVRYSRARNPRRIYGRRFESAYTK
ncbi:hypothetical protein [Natronorarus salvus]|uniref:hypothetical protein n=1 Tax=Natronorarus salvus TaxID=3117733 RepID=UPI002F263ED0